MVRDENNSEIKDENEIENLDTILVSTVEEFVQIKAEIVQARKNARMRTRQIKFEQDQKERGHLDVKLAKSERIIGIATRFWRSEAFMRVMDISRESSLLFRTPRGEPSIVIWESDRMDMEGRFQSLAICEDGGLLYAEQARGWRARYRNRFQEKKFFTAAEMASILSLDEILTLDMSLTYKNVINFVNRQVKKETHKLRGLLIDGMQEISPDEDDDDVLWDGTERERGRFF